MSHPEAIVPDHVIPPLPGAGRPNLLAAAAFAVSIASAGMVAATFSILQEQARYVESLPPGSFSGGMAFSANFNLFRIILLSVGVGAVALVLLVISLGYARESQQRVLTTLHIGAAICLLPSAYLLLTFVLHFVRAAQR